MAFDVSTFKSNLFSDSNYGGARPSLFTILINDSATTSTFSATETVLVKAAAIPSANITPLPINYAGRAYKLTGFRTYDNWTCTILNDEGFSIRKKIMNWMYLLAGGADGKRDTAFGVTNSTGDATITQIGVDGSERQAWKMHNLWPTELGEIPLDWSNDAVEEYTVSWAYDYWSHGTKTSKDDEVKGQGGSDTSDAAGVN